MMLIYWVKAYIMVRRNMEVLLVASRKIGVGVNAQETGVHELVS